MKKKSKKKEEDKRCGNCKHAFSRSCPHVERRNLAYGICEEIKWSSLMKTI